MTARGLVVQAAFWICYGAVHFLARVPAIDADERSAIALASTVLALTGMALGALVTCAIELAGRHTPREWIVGLGAALVAAAAWMFADRALLVALASTMRSTIPWERFPRGLDLEYLFVMLTFTAALLALRAHDRQRILAEQVLVERLAARDARLAAISARLSPHFLFNALNTARSLAAEDAQRTRELLTRIADFLRHALDVDLEAPVTVRDEIATVRTYLAIESARFEDALSIEISIDPNAESLLVPSCVLQPLIENAVRYADADECGRRQIRIRAGIMNGSLVIVVQNSGSISSSPRENSGLSIARARLEHLYAARQSIHLDAADGVVTATVLVHGPRRGGEA